MDFGRRQFLSSAGAAVVAAVVPRPAAAQTYPARPVRVIVPYATGGPTDVTARLIAQKLSGTFGKQFYVENIPGASGNIGMGRAAKATPDGYTLLITADNYTVNPALYDKIPYDPRRDFDPVTLAATAPMVLVVNASVPARTMKDLVTLIKGNPGNYNYASGGVGTPGHLVGEQLRLSLGLDLLHIPYNSAGLAVSSTIAGHTPICIVAPAPVVPQLADGKLRALAVMSTTRSPAMPDVPTVAEAGFPGIEAENWYGMLVPSGTPAAITAQLHREVSKMITLPETEERFAALGFEPVATTPAEFGERIAVELDRWAKLIRIAGLRIE
jgi:tripartite-type tricarboxylate transporter receptor subunit TctC